MNTWKVSIVLALTHSLLCLSIASAQDADPMTPEAEPVTPEEDALPLEKPTTPDAPADDDELGLAPPSSDVNLMGGGIGTDEEEDNKVATVIGVAITAGVGVLWFSDDTFNDQVDIGGTWDARVAIGTRLPATLELSYTGSLNNIEDPNSNVSLFSNGLDAKIRVQLPFDSLFMPYIFGGVGWRNYGAVNFDDNESATLNIEDDVLEVPVGLGFAFRFNNIIIDLRSTYRFAFFADNTDDSATLEESNFNNLSGVLSAGVEF